MMPLKEEFQSIYSMPLLVWLVEQPADVTWWLWGSIALLGLLTLNTIFCSIDSVIKKMGMKRLLLVISPQVIHIGFLLILLAHLLSSIGGFKGYRVAQEGAVFNMPDNIMISVKKINMHLDREGFLADWSVDIEYSPEGSPARAETLLPNKPSFYKGIGIYVKDLRYYPRAILLEVSREPGAVPALIGGILFMAGTFSLLILKIKRDED